MNETTVVRSVVRFLGVLGIILAGELGVMAWKVIDQGAGVKEIDPAAVAIVGAIATAFAGVAGYIGGLLSTTRGSDADQMARDQERVKLLAELEELRKARAVDVAFHTRANVDTAVVNADTAVVNAPPDGGT